MSAFDFPAWAHILFAKPDPKLAPQAADALTNMIQPPKIRAKPGPKPGSKRKAKEPA